MTLWENLVVVINMPGVTSEERQAFQNGFKEYSYLESDTPVPIALWVFQFPKPHGTIDVNFNAKNEGSEKVKNYLEMENCQIRNTIQFFLVDGQILLAIKVVGIASKAIEMFQATILKQLETEYIQTEYDKYLQAMFSYSPKELFQMGKVFKLMGL